MWTWYKLSWYEWVAFLMVYGINVNIDDAFGQSIRTPRCVCVCSYQIDHEWHWHIVFGYLNVFAGIPRPNDPVVSDGTESFHKLIFPSLRKSFKYPLRRCLDPQEVFGVPSTDPQKVFGRQGFIHINGDQSRYPHTTHHPSFWGYILGE